MPAETISFQDTDYDFDGLEALVWDLLSKGAQFGRDPLHTGVLSTLGPDDFPASRTMVLREVDVEKRVLVAYSDIRASKTQTLARFPRVSWVFYDARRRIEVRATGTMRVYAGPGDAVAEAVWAGMSHSAQHAFSGAVATGTRLAERAPDLTGPGPTAAHVEAQSLQNYANFAVLATAVERLEFLYLHPAGHHRARFVYQDGKLVERYWIAV